MGKLNENIAILRKRIGMTQEELGRAVSVSTQAVSRWERGGAPDISLLPEIARVFGVSLDTLFGYGGTEHVQLEEVVLDTVNRVPAEERLDWTYRLFWHTMKAVVSSLETSVPYFQFMTSNEDAERSGSADPESVPSVVYFAHDTGLMQASTAKDFHYVLAMPEPEDGFASVMKYGEDYRRFFAFLAKPHRVELLAYLYSFKSRQHFSLDLAAQTLGISPEEAEKALDELYRMRLVQVITVDTPEGETHVYCRTDNTSPIPFLYMASEVMWNQSVFSAFPMRNTPLFTAPLGTGNPCPSWKLRSASTQDQDTLVYEYVVDADDI